MHYCLAICIVVVIVQFVCIILPNWSTKSVLSGTMNMGLWKACSEITTTFPDIKNATDCSDKSKLPLSCQSDPTCCSIWDNGICQQAKIINYNPLSPPAKPICANKMCKSIPASLDSSFPSFWLYLARILSILGFLFTLLSIVSCKLPQYEQYQSIFLLSAGISSLLAVIVWSMKLTNISGGSSSTSNAGSIKYDNGYCLYLMFLMSLILLAVYVYEKVEK